MLFSSYAFLVLFLPPLLAAAWITRKWNLLDIRLVLLVASLIFYGSWNIGDLGIILALIAMNYGFARAVARWNAKPVLAAAIAANLAVLFYFKYFDFALNGVLAGDVAGYQEHKGHLPLGISFFTFQKIAYLVDVSKRRAPVPSKLNFGLFIAFFPQLIAGPIVHYRNLGRQIERMGPDVLSARNVAVGAAIFTIGLMKKILLADRLSLLVDPVYHAVGAGGTVTFADSWLTVLAYSLQIYFDFSGYTDMAIGLALLFGIVLPDNFLSPYRARNIAQFWRRWHITLSRFLRDYLYIPMGGSRRGLGRNLANLVVTMALGGLWHGANWTFLAWGLIHGAMLAGHRLWTKTAGRGDPSFIGKISGAALTFLAVSLAWVFFRAADIGDAFRMFAIMADPGAGLGTAAFENPKRSLLLLALGCAVVFLAPGSCVIRRMLRGGVLNGRPVATALLALALAAGFVLSFMKLGEVNAFIYFQF